MSSKQVTVVGLMWILVSSHALAELADPSILTRYGITPDQLPAVQAGKSAEVLSPRPRFDVRPEQPLGSVSLGDTRKPDTTGNISIDHSIQQEYERCRRLQGDSLRRKTRLIDCEEGNPAPGVGTGFTR